MPLSVNTVKTRIRNALIRADFPQAHAGLSDDESIELDSVWFLSLIGELELEFDVLFDETQLTYENFGTIEAIFASVSRALAAEEPLDTIARA